MAGPLVRVWVQRLSQLGLGVLPSLTSFEFKVDAPSVQYMYPTRVPDEGGIMTLIGHSFGPRGHVFFGGLTYQQDIDAVIETQEPEDVNMTQLLQKEVHMF